MRNFITQSAERRKHLGKRTPRATAAPCGPRSTYNELMRLFVAAELPDGLLDVLVETQAALRESVAGRYVAPDSLHVTLACLGNVEAARIPLLESALDEACAGVCGFEVATAGLGSFGRRAQATLWQGFTASDEFAQLAKRVRRN